MYLRGAGCVGALLSTAMLVFAGSVPPASAEPSSGSPGTVVSSHEVTGDPNTRIAGAAHVISMSYLSRDAKNRVVPVRGTVFVPAAKPGADGWRMMGFAHGTTGVGRTCSDTDKMGVEDRYDPWLGPWLKAGYAIAAPEYAGIGDANRHVYLDGRTSGRNVIDAVRAARSIVDRYTDRPVSSDYVTNGGSQGGHAALWAGRLASTYGSGLKNVGTVANSAPLNIAEYFKLVRPGLPPVAVPDYATYFSYVLTGLKRARPDVDVDSYLTPRGRQVVKDAGVKCYSEMAAATDRIPVGQLVARPFSEGPLIPALQKLISVPASNFTAPVLVQQGVYDPVSVAPLTRQWVGTARSDGADVTLSMYPASHGIGPDAEVAALHWSQRLGWSRR